MRNIGQLHLLLDAGGVFFRQVPVDGFSRKKALFIGDLYKEMGYDAVAVAPKDLVAGLELLREVEKKGITLLSANLFMDGKRLFPAYKVFELNGLKVGVVGVTGRLPGYISRIDSSVEVRPAVEILPGVVKEIQREDIDILILLSSVNPGYEKDIVRQDYGIDLVISSGRRSTRANPARINGCSVVTVTPLGKSIGSAMVVTSTQNGKKVSVRSRNVSLNQTVPNSRKIEAMIDSFFRQTVQAR